jgi:hypothetical protein
MRTDALRTIPLLPNSTAEDEGAGRDLAHGLARKVLSTAALIGLSGLLGGCPGSFSSELEQLTFEAPSLGIDPLTTFAVTQPVAAGTELCFTPQDQELLDCFEQTITGDAALDANGCLVLGADGSVQWEFDPIPCDHASSPTLTSDSVTLQIAPSAEITGDFKPWLESAGVALTVPAGGGSLPSDWIAPAGASVLLVADRSVRLQPSLHWSGSEVAWNPDGASVSVEAITGPAASASWVTEGVAESWAGGVEVMIEAGAESRISLTSASGASWPLGTVVGVAESELVSLELVGLHFAESLGDVALSPMGARAILRTLEGEPVIGAPVAWVLTEGQMALSDFAYRPSQDYLQLSDNCELPSLHVGDHTATLEATLNDLSGSVAFDWSYNPDELPDETDWEPHEDCTGGTSGDDDDAADDDDATDDDDTADDSEPEVPACACNTAVPARSAPFAAGLFVAAFLLRRRRCGPR